MRTPYYLSLKRQYLAVIIFLSIANSLTFFSCSNDDVDALTTDSSAKTSQNRSAKLAPVANAIYYIKNVNSDLYLDVAKLTDTLGPNIIQSVGTQTANQQWELISTPTANTYYIKNRSSAKVISIANNSSANGANIIQAPLTTGTSHQEWTITVLEDHTFKINNADSNKSLDVEAKSIDDGANVQQWVFWGGPNQRWMLEPAETPPCDFDVSTIAPHTDILINCIYDLNGETLTMPNGVTLKHGAEGKLINGTISGDNLKIDGKLLNSTLKIGTGNATLITPEFSFEKENWSLTEGPVSKTLALNNRKHLNSIIELVKRLGATVFEIDQLDAYFDVSGVAAYNPKNFAPFSIRIPSNFHFKMSPRTFLRVQPSSGWADQLLYSSQTENVKISGGHLIGDRIQHDYVSAADGDSAADRSTHEYGSLVYFGGVINADIDNIQMKDHTGDCIQIQSSGNRRKDGAPVPGETYTKNIRITNCILDGARRNNISLTSCENVLIENNTILNAGLEVPENPDAKGTDPRASIDLEAFRETETINGTNILNEYEIVTNVTIRNNDFRGNFRGINFFSTSNVTVTLNHFDDGVTMLQSSHITVDNNIFDKGPTSNYDPVLDRACYFTSFLRNGVHQNTNNSFTNNTVTGYGLGVGIGGKNAKVLNNNIRDCTEGISFFNGDSNGILIDNNSISSALETSIGFSALIGEIEDVLITNNTVNVQERHVSFGNINKKANTNTPYIVFDGCTFETKADGTAVPIVFSGSNNITVKNSTNVSVTHHFTTSNIVLENNN